MLRIRLFLIPLILSYVLFLIGCKNDLGNVVPPGPKWRTFTAETTPLVNNTIHAVSVDAEEKIWFGTDGGASTLRGTVWNSYVADLAYTYFDNGGSTISHTVNSITNGVDGSTWFGLRGGGVRRYFPTSSSSQWTTFTSDNTLGQIGDNVLQLVADKFAVGGNSEIWAASLFGGVSKYTPRTTDPKEGDWKMYTTSDGLPTDNITSVQVNFVARNIWFGSGYGNLTYYDNGLEWRQESVPNGYNGPVNCIAFDGPSILWMGTVDGAFRRSVGWTFFTTADGLPSNDVHAIVVDSRNIKWFGSDAGLTRFDNYTFSTFDHTNSPLLNDTVNALGVDLDGRIWIGTNHGAAVYDPNGI